MMRLSNLRCILLLGIAWALCFQFSGLNSLREGPSSRATVHIQNAPSTRATPKISRTHSGSKANRSNLIRKYNQVVKNVAIDVSLFVRPTDSVLMEYHEALTPIVLEEYKLVLFTYPKIGSTVLKQLMRRMMGYEADYHEHRWGSLPHHWPENGLNYTAHYSLENVNEMMTSDEWTRATFVRDPKERVLSAFLMLRPRVDIAPEVIHKAKRGKFTNESLWEMYPDLSPPQIANCCRRRPEFDANFQLLCLDHVRSFEGFLDVIQNANSGARLRVGDIFSATALRNAAGCADIHWSPLSHLRSPKFDPTLNFVGHLETAQQDLRLLLDRLDPNAWERFGASGWGAFRKESIFSSSTTVSHAQHTKDHLLEYYTSNDIERRVEDIYTVDYENKYLNLERRRINDVK